MTTIRVIDRQPSLATHVAGSAPTVREIVHETHETGIETGLERFGLDRDGLEQALTYCAEQQCETDLAACAGCRKYAEREGVTTLDAFCQRFEAITFAAGSASLTGLGGQGTFHAESVSALADAWAGEEYWFWARRMLRKLRYGQRQAETLFDTEFQEAAAPSVILVEPQIAENIGMTARAMANFGLDDVRVTNPRDGWPNEKARATASGAAGIVDNAGLHPDLESAIGDLNWTVATTARQRDMRKPILTPEAAAREMRERTAAGQRCGIIFGRERNGLESTEVALANAIVMIPVNPKFASLNLAQAVLLLGYAWLRSGDASTLGRKTPNDRRIGEGLHLGHDVPAKQAEMLGFFEHLEDELGARGFFNPPERRHVTVRNLRSLFQRLAPTAQEVRTLRGIIATLSKRGRVDR
ncbi:MAG: RNA methyltransferase [Pseudomonadota bacterium]